MYSSSRFGRTLSSMRASSSNACPDTIRSGCPDCIIRFAVPSAICLPPGLPIIRSVPIWAQPCCAHARRTCYAPRAARPFGALNDCNAPRSNFSKLPVPASRLASPTAFSAARPSYPRFTSAEITSASIPAGEEAAGLSVSTATASSLSFSSTTMRSAVFRPTPGILVNRARSLPRIAGTSSSTLMPLKIFSASVGPTPDAESSISKKCFSRAETNPYSASASSRTCVWIRRVTSVCSSPSAPYVESGTCTRYPTPPTSTSTWFGLFSASCPRSWAIIARQYCRLFFACQREPRLPITASAAVFANQFGLREDVALHGALDVGFGGASFQIQFRIERVELEKIAVRLAGRRARPAVTDFAEIIAALTRAIRKLLLLRDSLRKLSGVRGQVEEHPVDPRAHGSVGIVHDEREALRLCRRIIPGELGRNVRPIT